MQRVIAASVLVVALGLASCDEPPTAPETNAQQAFGLIASNNASGGGNPNNGTMTAVFTTFDRVQLGCTTGGNPNGINCNHYRAKPDVYVGGGPQVQQLNNWEDGSYFFAVLTPGEQNGGFLDGARGNLSDVTVGGTSGDNGSGDGVSNRTFTVNNGNLSYGGTHIVGVSPQGNAAIQLYVFDDTDNPGGVYIMAVCRTGATSPSDCKYDAFKIDEATPPPQPDALALTASKTASGAYDNVYTWTIEKAVDKTVVKQSTSSATFDYTVTVTHDGGTISNVKVSGTVTINNPNAHEVVIVGVSDQLSDGTECAVVAPETLAPGNTVLSYSCSLSALPSGPLNNTATVTWNEQMPGGLHLDEGSATATVAGINFAENVIDDSAVITDTQAGALGTLDRSSASPTEFTYSKTFDGNTAGTCTSHDNTATFTTNSSSTTGSASKTVKVCVGANLTASKTADPAFTRTYAWKVEKAVDKTTVKQAGGSATFTYTVNATQTGSTDSDWKVTGIITVNNPNDWEAVTVNLSDAIDNGGSCSVSGGSSVSVPASGSVSRPYVCTYSAAPAEAAFNNTATVTWDAEAAFTPDGSARGVAPGAFGAPTTRLHSSVTVVDTFNDSPSTLGTVTASDVTPATGTWTYPRTVPVTANVCLTYDNTATFTSNNGATGSASRSVMVCGNVAGGLTIGFWSNKNGQAIITGGSSTAGVCNSGTWLSGYAPFADLGAAANCAAVGRYALTIIKAANASGASMNAMLKAQMLATALDVYFSDPAAGGNRISAPAPIGGVKVDLTMICSSIGACSSTYANVSAAFGGATALTVNQILAYAASQSNSGGTDWYGQVKTMQERAKNTFDAINNRVALVSP